MKKIFALFLITLFVVSCGDGYDRLAERDKVIDVHDEVMPKLGEVMNLRKQVLNKVSEIEGDSSKVESLRDLAMQLDDARKGMMTWMNDWSKTSAKHVNGESTVDEQKAYFAAEMKRVTKVKDDINSSIDEAKEVLK
ncbi:hypothetical protein [Roseivirga misakiensis]|uniref:Viral A-type inclusion protein n=1 Tax=Roseivirga misakiensis TaxID=1563681 RepID=A0A1E5T5A5_9BACT|nr:hypothetical protein [Roseivirga misakiensis]OEK06540.1 hypothetical protein BFP71_02395 [Roseivirga misakiensis]